MYAVIISGGKQYRVTEGQTIKLQKMTAELETTIDFDKVLMVSNGEDIKIGAPLVKGGKVTASIVSHGRHDKIHILKFRRRKHHMKRMGHRQDYTEVKIVKIAV